ncbi:hypothetical protein BOSE127_170247 [Bosea sp. 127]|nr:hypothetical protein BOSE127_170247 [Bosea sp. 127]
MAIIALPALGLSLILRCMTRVFFESCVERRRQSVS